MTTTERIANLERLRTALVAAKDREESQPLPCAENLDRLQTWLWGVQAMILGEQEWEGAP